MTLAVYQNRHGHDVDEHGDFRYTLRQFLLMRRNNQGGDWSEVVAHADREQRENPDWDMDWKDTYMGWQRWYYGDREIDRDRDS